jgi:hypothetical protein
MGYHNIMQNTIINSSGWLSTFAAVLFNGSNWLSDFNFSQAGTLFISVLSAIFLFMKMYDQYLITKDRKRKMKEESK